MYYKKENPHGGSLDKRIMDFSASVNPLGPPESVLSAIRESLSDIARYPDPYATELAEAIAEFEDVPREFITIGNGASEIIYSYCAALKPKRAIVFSPTFSEYEDAVKANGGSIERIILKEENDFQIDVSILRPGPCDDTYRNHNLLDVNSSYANSSDANSPDGDGFNKDDAIFICNPNNPTGKLASKDFMKSLLGRAMESGASVFVDECFIDLSESSWNCKEFLREYPNLFILKAFTKTFAVPGLRLGYGMTSNEELLEKISAVTPPWNISSIAMHAGIAALNEKEYIVNAKHLIQAERKKLEEALAEAGYKVIPSDANYILFYSKNQNLREALLEKGFAIRDCKNFSGLDPGWYRIGIRKSEDNDALIKAIKEINEDK